MKAPLGAVANGRPVDDRCVVGFRRGANEADVHKDNDKRGARDRLLRHIPLKRRANAHPCRQSQHHPLDDAEDRRRGEGRRFARRRGQRRQSRVWAAQHRGLFRRGVLASGFEEIGKAANADAFVIACFDDTGLEAARCATGAPVVGIGEAAFHMASLIADKFSVVTTLSRSIAPIEHNLAKYGLSRRCARVRAADAPVLGARDRTPARGAHRTGDRARARGRRRRGDRARLRRHDRSRARSRGLGRSPGARRGRLRGQPRREPGPAGLEDIEAQYLRCRRSPRPTPANSPASRRGRRSREGISAPAAR